MLSYFPRLTRRCNPRRRETSGHRTSGLWRAAALVLAGGLFGVPSAHSATRAPTATQGTDQTSTAAGSWAGMLAEGGSQLHLILTVTRLSSGEYTAVVNSVDQGGTLQVDSVTVRGRAVGFEIKSEGVTYQGTLSDSGTDIEGAWKQADDPPLHLAFKRSAASAMAAPRVTAAGPTEKPLAIQLEVGVPMAPTAFDADGKFHLVYELHLTNIGSWNCLLAGLEVTGKDTGSRVLASFSQANLEGMIRPEGGGKGPHAGVTATERSRLAPGASAVVYVWITVSRREDLPTALRHRFSVKVGEYPRMLVLRTDPVPVGSNALVISPPLSGDHWVAVRGPSNTSGHRRGLLSIDGRATIAERFAIDWMRVDESGKSYRGDPHDNRNYLAYGAQALAVADGVVVATLDGIAENVPNGSSRAIPITLETVGGNYVILDIGGGHYAFYAHLQPGSLRVKRGDPVRRGQVLGWVGNSGNSTEPHLHFHITDAASPLHSEGLPYALTSFVVQGLYAQLDAGKGGKPVQETHSLPTENEVVRFPATP
jgi:hypothetical protein